MLIGEVAALAHVSTRAIRHYHRIGLMPEPERRANGYRVYSVVDLTWLLRIRRLVTLGLPLDRVRIILHGSLKRTTAAELQELEGVLREHIRVLNRQLDAVLIAQASVLPEAAPLYNENQVALQALWSHPEIRQIEGDVSLLLAASRDSRFLERLGEELADPQRVESFAHMAEHLRTISDESSEDERGAAIAALRASLLGIEDLHIADPVFRALVEDYVDRFFNDSQREVLRQAFPH